jgi:hypothetical protein
MGPARWTIGFGIGLTDGFARNIAKPGQENCVPNIALASIHQCVGDGGTKRQP